jgi:hypothetical protein
MHGSSIPSNPVRAAGKVAGVRSAVLESGMSDADLWEKKRKDGLSAADATAYVNARTKR